MSVNLLNANRTSGRVVWRLFIGLCLLTGMLLRPTTTDAQRKQRIPFRKTQKKKQPATVGMLGRIGGFPNWVMEVAISPDGKTLAAGSDGVVKIIDLTSRKVTVSRKTKPGYIRALAFSPAGRLLAVGGYESLDLWNTKTWKPVKKLIGHTGQVTGVAFSPDGKRLVSGSLDQTVRVWDVETGKEVRQIDEFEYPVGGVAFSPSGKWIATASGDEYRATRHGLVKLWNVKTGKEKTWRTTNENGEPKILRLVDHLKAANSVAFSPDGRTLISTSFDEKVNVYDVTTGKALGYFDGHGRPTNDAVFFPDGVTVVSAAGGRFKGRYFVMIWSSREGEKFATLEGHRGPVNCVAVSPDGNTVASGSHDKTVILWDVTRLRRKIHKALREVPVEAPKPKAEAETQSRLLRPPTVHSVTETVLLGEATGGAESTAQETSETNKKSLRIGIIGLDTSHVIAFTRVLNNAGSKGPLANCRVVAAYPKGSPDIESSVSRVPKYTKQIKQMGVTIVPSIPKLIDRVDAVLLETNDGRPHLRQVLPVLKAGKPVFIDKPLAGSLADAVAIFQASKKYDTPVFSSSSLRYMSGAQAIRAGKIGTVKHAEAYSPCSLEPTHPDLYWYGIHGVEALFTMMGPGCLSVKRTVHTQAMDEVVGKWSGGRVGIFRGYRKGGKRGYGGSAKGTKGEMSAGKYEGYRSLVVDIVTFFRTGKPPVDPRETLEIYAFMSAADESKRQDGGEVTLTSVLQRARKAAEKRLAELDPRKGRRKKD